MNKYNVLKKIIPILKWLPNYKKKNLYYDFFAGINVGILLIPQGMAYALIAGLPPIYGLYAALIPQIVYAILGTSRQLSVGPVAIDSLIVASGLGIISILSPEQYILMAISFVLVSNNKKCKGLCKPLGFFIAQLVLNLLWTTIFFRWKQVIISFIVIIRINPHTSLHRGNIN